MPDDAAPPLEVPVAIATRRVQLSKSHLRSLFGDDAELTPIAPLSQPDELACLETVRIKGPSGVLDARVVTPVVDRTRIEISTRDQSALGIEGPARLSLAVDGSLGCALEGPKGTVMLAEGVLNALRHLQLPPDLAKRHQLKDDDVVVVQVDGERARDMADVVVRIREGATPFLYVDTEEANSLELSTSTRARFTPG